MLYITYASAYSKMDHIDDRFVGITKIWRCAASLQSLIILILNGRISWIYCGVLRVARVRALLSRGFRLGSFARAHHTLSVVRLPRHTLSRRHNRYAPRVRLLQES